MDTKTLTSKSEKHLINILTNTHDHNPKFALFLGAGASITSGVKSSKEMIKDWRKQHLEQFAENSENEEDHFKQYHWYKTPEEYSYLFETLYDQPSQRRAYIESCIRKAAPSWGYIYLVNLIKHSFFNTILTTNFDDLLNEACYQFSSDVRPMVCAHDSSIQSIRITSLRPKIIKLHGDFLFDNIKNTIRELETLELNIREKIKQISSEFGLIIIGYSGNDRSIMDCLNTLLNNEHNFPHGLYWCVLKNETQDIAYKLQSIIRFPKVTLIEIDGFDGFFANLNDALAYELQDELSDPYKMLAKKLNDLLDNTKIPKTNIHPVINKDIQNLGKKLKEIANTKELILNPQEVSTVLLDTGKGILKLPIPYYLIAQIYERENDFNTAIQYMMMQLGNHPNSRDFDYSFKLLIKSDKKNEYLYDFYRLLKENTNAFCGEYWVLNEIGVNLVSLLEYDKANEIFDLALTIYEKESELDESFEIYIKLNKMQIIQHKGENLTSNDITYLQNLKKNNDDITKLGALILLKESNEAINLMTKLLSEEKLIKRDVETWPIFHLLPVTISEDGKTVEKIKEPEKINANFAENQSSDSQ